MATQVTDIDRLKGIFTDYRNAGNFRSDKSPKRQTGDIFQCCGFEILHAMTKSDGKVLQTIADLSIKQKSDTSS